MSNVNTTATLTAEMKTFYSEQAVAVVESVCAYRKHAKKTSLPKNQGKTVNWRKFDKFDLATTPLTEGEVPAGNKLKINPITATVHQYGDYTKLTDLVLLHCVDPILVETNHTLAVQAGETLDYLAGSAYCAGNNVIFAGGKTSRAELTASDTISVTDILKAAQFLKSKSAQKIENAYWCIIHPDVAFDLMSSEGWIDVTKYANNDKIVEGEIGKLHGVRFIETPNAIKIGDAYQTIVYGDNAFGCVDVAGANLQTIVKQLGSAGTSDPLNQNGSAGWKCEDATVILNDDFLIRIESCSGI